MSELARKAARHWRWARQDGLSTLIEEDDLKPMSRASRAWRKWRWRRPHTRPEGKGIAVWGLRGQGARGGMGVGGLSGRPPVGGPKQNDRAPLRRLPPRAR